jgi:hypothetical protein
VAGHSPARRRGAVRWHARGASEDGRGVAHGRPDGPPQRKFRISHRDPCLNQVDKTLMRANSASDFRRLLAARAADAETKHPPTRIGNGEGGFRPHAAPSAFRRITNLPVGALDWPDRRNGVHAPFPQMAARPYRAAGRSAIVRSRTRDRTRASEPGQSFRDRLPSRPVTGKIQANGGLPAS